MDLNLIRVFVAVYETGSLTLAGARLYVTQSAISQSLGKLRDKMSDPLFERVGREMRPTPLAEQLFPSFHQALGSIDRALVDVNGFDPTVSERVFRIALSELGEVGWLTHIHSAVTAQAPRIRLKVVLLDADNLTDWLNRGSIDVAVTPIELPVDYERIHLKHESYSIVMSKDNPLANKKITKDEFRNADLVVVGGDSGAHLLDHALRKAGVEVRPSVVIQHYSTLPPLLSSSDSLISIVPESIARGWAHQWPLHLGAIPFDVPSMELNLYRRQSTDNQAALDWIFRTIGEAIAGDPGDFSSIKAV